MQVKVTAFAAAAEHLALAAVGEAATLEPAAVLQAARQVVAGTHYGLRLRIVRDGEARTADAAD